MSQLLRPKICFAVSGPTLWHSLPLSVRDPSLTLTQFCASVSVCLVRGWSALDWKVILFLLLLLKAATSLNLRSSQPIFSGCANVCTGSFQKLVVLIASEPTTSDTDGTDELRTEDKQDKPLAVVDPSDRIGKTRLILVFIVSALETQTLCWANTEVSARFSCLEKSAIELKLSHSEQNGLNSHSITSFGNLT